MGLKTRAKCRHFLENEPNIIMTQYGKNTAKFIARGAGMVMAAAVF